MAQQTVLRQYVYEQIKHDIIICKLAPGEPISENQFLDRFQVSKTPIREALTSLVQDGLVEYTPNRGFRVTPISVTDIQEIFEARIFFEAEIFRLAVRKISDAEIDELEKHTWVEGDPGSPEHAEAFLESNRKFHTALAAASRNMRLLSYYETLMNETQRLFYMDISLHNKEFRWGHGHEGIIQALRNRDEAAGVTAIRETLETARKRVLGI
ncbi:MAG TPA: GntR family transcriptional regulator [Anaerolineales bacterium]|jgi:DNA-binding GntR family transcriptional regulator|nr:GntR family transcriptional regulator [Anaerolineales bacterium]